MDTNTKSNKKIRKARNTAKPKSLAGNSKGISDFNKDIPNIVKVTSRYGNTGNVFLGFEKGHHEPWRFGKNFSQLHPQTILNIENKATYYLNTEKVLAYLYERKASLPIYRGKGFGGMPNASYIVSISALVKYCQDDLSITRHVA